MSVLHFKKMDADQSEVWFEDNGPRLISNDGIRLAVQQLCSPEVFDAFCSGYPDIGQEIAWDNPNAESLAGQFELRGAEQDARPQ